MDAAGEVGQGEVRRVERRQRAPAVAGGGAEIRGALREVDGERAPERRGELGEVDAVRR